MTETKPLPGKKETFPDGKIHLGIAEKIRDESKNLARLTGVDDINRLLPELGPGEIAANLQKVEKDKTCKDIKSVSVSAGSVYFYSETYITCGQAAILARSEDIKNQIAAKVRDDSKNLVKLTGVDSLNSPPANLTADEVMSNFTGILNEEKFHDIKSIIAPNGTMYLYSEAFISRSYAEILVRAETNDPCVIIAETVRDNSRIYPRPTNIDLFREEVFNISPADIEKNIALLIGRPEFTDIKAVEASTGARYLFSNTYLDENYARSLIEWQEVEQYANQ